MTTAAFEPAFRSLSSVWMFAHLAANHRLVEARTTVRFPLPVVE